MLDRHQPIAQIVLDHSACAAVFARHGIDFCCRGNQSVVDAVTEKKLEIEPLMEELSVAIAASLPTPEDEEPRLWGTPRLIATIVRRHHDYLRDALPFVRGLALKVARVHGGHNVKLPPLSDAVGELAELLTPHLNDEEQSLFPAMLRADAKTELAPGELAFDAILHDHLEVGACLTKIQTLSENFDTPSWACTSYRTLMAELEALNRDIHVHIHLENHVLFPRFSQSVGTT